VGIDDPAPDRDGLPLPGRTVPDVVSQLCFRVLGPFDNRARSVLDWAGLGGGPPGSLAQTAGRFSVTDRAIAHRIRRVAAVGARLPLDADLEREVTRPSPPGGGQLARARWAQLLGRTPRAEGAEIRVASCVNAKGG
jgi:hypothetical protein